MPKATVMFLVYSKALVDDTDIIVFIRVVEHIQTDGLSELNHKLAGVTSVNHGRV
jgi:hypothetical protein